MKFLIPTGGKTLSLGKKLVSLKAGEFETEDKPLQDLLLKAKGVLRPQAKKQQAKKED